MPRFQWTDASAKFFVLLSIAAAFCCIMLLELTVRHAIGIHPLGSTAAPYGYVEYVPATAAKHPLLIVLHGSGSIGDGHNPRELIAHIPLFTRAVHARLFGEHSVLAEAGVWIVAPQSPGAWDTERLDSFIRFLLESHSFDPTRVYLTGYSMGGCGAWRYAVTHPERLAAVIPVCTGCLQTGEIAPATSGVSIHAFHAFDDEIVPNYWSATWFSTIAAGSTGTKINPMLTYPQGKDATAMLSGREIDWVPSNLADANQTLALTVLARGGHDAWFTIYEDPDTWRWLVAQQRRRE